MNNQSTESEQSNSNDEFSSSDNDGTTTNSKSSSSSLKDSNATNKGQHGALFHLFQGSPILTASIRDASILMLAPVIDLPFSFILLSLVRSKHSPDKHKFGQMSVVLNLAQELHWDLCQDGSVLLLN